MCDETETLAWRPAALHLCASAAPPLSSSVYSCAPISWMTWIYITFDVMHRNKSRAVYSDISRYQQGHEELLFTAMETISSLTHSVSTNTLHNTYLILMCCTQTPTLTATRQGQSDNKALKQRWFNRSHLTCDELKQYLCHFLQSRIICSIIVGNN